MNAPMVEHDVDRIQFVETQSDHINVTVKMVSRREEEYVLVGALNFFQGHSSHQHLQQTPVYKNVQFCKSAWLLVQ